MLQACWERQGFRKCLWVEMGVIKGVTGYLLFFLFYFSPSLLSMSIPLPVQTSTSLRTEADTVAHFMAHCPGRQMAQVFPKINKGVWNGSNIPAGWEVPNPEQLRMFTEMPPQREKWKLKYLFLLSSKYATLWLHYNTRSPFSLPPIKCFHKKSDDKGHLPKMRWSLVSVWKA